MWASHVETALFSWDRYTYAVAEALETPGRFRDAMVLLRRAPQELATMLSSQPVITTADLCVFIVYMTRPGRAYRDAQERAQFYQVLRALFRVATHLFDWPADHPMLKIFQGFIQTDDEDLHQLAKEAWKLGTSTMDLFLDNLGPSGTPFCSGSSSHRATYRPGTIHRAPPELICLVDETMRRVRAGYGASQPWCLDSLYHRPEGIELLVADESPPPPPAADLSRHEQQQQHTPTPEQPQGSTQTNGPPSLVPAHTDAAIDEMVAKICRALYEYKAKGGAKIISMKALFDAHSAYAQHDRVNRRFAEKYLRNCITAVCDEFGRHEPLARRYLAELEGALLAWGEADKAREVVRWRGELLGDDDDVELGRVQRAAPGEEQKVCGFGQR